MNQTVNQTVNQNVQALLSIKNLCISTKELELIKNYNLELGPGQSSCISSPTGTGKTTLFNYIADLLPSAVFKITGEVQKTPGLKISYAFQEPRLLASLTALKNVMLPLEKLLDSNQAKSIAQAWLEKFKLDNKICDRPEKLSGGEQQRTGLARAFAYAQVQTSLKKSPCLLLLDEPFASQDQANAENIRNLIKEELLLPDLAVLLISHDRFFKL